MAKKKDNLTPSQKDDASLPSSQEVSSSLASAIIKRYSELESQRSYYMAQWELIGRFIMPRKSFILTTMLTPTMDRETSLFTSCGINANKVLAAGCMAYITPTDSRWCSYRPPEDIDDDEEVNQYFAKVTEVVLEQLARSNFYTTIHELYLDRGCFGTAVMHVEPGDTDDTPLVFRTFDVGTFCIAENHERLVDTCFVKYKATIRAAVMQFGIDNVSEKVRVAYNQANGQGQDQEIEIVHAIYPRDKADIEKGKKDPKNKPFASVYVEMDTKKLLRNGGYDEKPFFATRYLNWQKSVYGYSPAWESLADIKQLNFLEKMLDCLAEIKVNPRMLIPEGMSGQVDTKAGGVTLFNPSDPNAVPREWLTGGDYNIGMERVKAKEGRVEQAFSVPLFQQFTQEDQKAGYPTAEEVRARQAEQLANFSPTFSRLTTELLTPLLIRLYGLMARMGLFPPPPQALIQVNPTTGEGFIPEPKIEFNSRMALAVKNMEVQATDASLKRALNIIQVSQDPSVLDVFDLDKILTGGAVNDGVDPDYLRSGQEIAQIRQQRAQAAAQQQQMIQQAHMADMAHKAGNIKPDSPLGQQIAKQQQ